MKRVFFLAAAVLFAAGSITPEVTAKTQTGPAVDVVFVLDTTGSMGGLIEGAKMKIWSIANQIVNGTPAPDLRIGLVAYRDRGDAYVTRVFDLSDDLDEVYGNLMQFEAAGGGDGPEHVSRALSDAVDGISWSAGDRTLRIVFLVGDAPPHTDYNDGFDYREICRTAVSRDIIVNTIQCGAMPETTEYWREIASLSEGEYAAVAQAGGMRTIPTPMDGELSRLGAELGKTVVVFGGSDMEARKREADEMAAAMPATAVATRAAYKSATGRMGAYDLLGVLEAEEVVLEDIEEEKLPEEMRGMNAEEKREFLRAKKESRDRLNKQIAELSRQRDAYIRDKLAEEGKADSFDDRVLAMIRAQAKSRGIKY
jgi:hypothetical protein